MARWGRYVTKDGRGYFEFKIVGVGGHHDIYCPQRPPLNGREGAVERTHIYSDNRLCFVAGCEPRTVAEAERRAMEWAEFYSAYVRE